jgi:hypothetical protein
MRHGALGYTFGVSGLATFRTVVLEGRVELKVTLLSDEAPELLADSALLELDESLLLLAEDSEPAVPP